MALTAAVRQGGGWVGGFAWGAGQSQKGVGESTTSWIWLQKVLLGCSAGTGLEATVRSPGG